MDPRVITFRRFDDLLPGPPVAGTTRHAVSSLRDLPVPGVVPF